MLSLSVAVPGYITPARTASLGALAPPYVSQ